MSNMALDSKVVKSMYSPFAILSLILVGITGGAVLVGLGGGGRMLTAGITVGGDVLVTTGGDGVVVTTVNGVIT